MNSGASRPVNDKTDENGKTDEAEKKDEKVNWFAEIRGLALMLLAVVVFHSFIAKPFYIPSQSMMPNLLVGDRLVVSKYPYGFSWASVSFHLAPRGDWRVFGSTPEYGDIVIPVHPERDEDYIKRVVALPGDRIAVTNGQIVLNGEPVPQEVVPPLEIPVDINSPCSAYDYPGLQERDEDGNAVCRIPTYRETLPNGASYLILDHRTVSLDNMDEVLVPEDHVFVMGDNRDHSADSRASIDDQGLGGPIPLKNVGGRAEFITFSLDGTAGWNPFSWFSAMRGDRAWTTLRPELGPPPASPEDDDTAS